ncbi:MAG: type II secretion system protein N [Endozoicomonadaceae bacterium]|nr:type II secretion system protein N [Endozoicomonadaceae bacterium]
MKKIILLGVVSFIVFVLMSAPASLLVPYVNQSPYFQAQSATGNIFSAKIHTTGEIKSISYQVNLWQLLLANASVDVQVARDDNTIQANLKVDLITQKVELNHLTGRLNLALLQQYIPELSLVEPQGYLSFSDVNVAWGDVRNQLIPEQLSGNIELLKLNALGQDFGDYELLIETHSPNIVGVLSGKESATTDAKIKLNLLDEKKQLVISGTITGKNENTSAILQQLNIGNIKQVIRY